MVVTGGRVCSSCLFPSHQSLLGLCGSPRLGRAIPLEGARQAFPKAHLGVVIKTFPRLRNVRLGVADVSISWRLIFRREPLAGNFSEFAKDFIEGDALAHADVENSSGSVGRFTRKQIG